MSDRCPICKAKGDEKCENRINPGEPLPGRSAHYARTEHVRDLLAADADHLPAEKVEG